MTASRTAKIAISTLAIALLGAGALGFATLGSSEGTITDSVAIGITQPAKPNEAPPTVPSSPPKAVSATSVTLGKTKPGRSVVDTPINSEPVLNELTSRPTATLTKGDSGPLVRELESTLSGIGYWLGNPDDSFDDLTRQAVVAFQKVEGLKRTGIADPETLTALLTAQRPQPRVTNEVANEKALPNRLDVELDRQVLFVVRDNQVALIIDVSTGAPSTRTPPGTFTVYRDVNGVDRGPLGSLYRPKYFYIGIAFHGYPRVPPTAASHGCVRVSNAAMDLLWSIGDSDIGNQVIVY